MSLTKKKKEYGSLNQQEALQDGCVSCGFHPGAAQ